MTVARGRYRHYKGHLYEALGEAKESETTEVLGVAYLRLDVDEPVVWVRPKAMFAEVVEGQPRFEKISDETMRGELHDCAENHYSALEGRALERALDEAKKRVAMLETQLHEPGYVDALREACERTAALVPKEFRQKLAEAGEDLDAVEALPDLVGKYITSLTEWSEDDKPLPEDGLIRAAHPTRSGRHGVYGEAFRMVGAKRSKFALVDLVNWLLVRLATEKVPEGKPKGR